MKILIFIRQFWSFCLNTLLHGLQGGFCNPRRACNFVTYGIVKWASLLRRSGWGNCVGRNSSFHPAACLLGSRWDNFVGSDLWMPEVSPPWQEDDEWHWQDKDRNLTSRVAEAGTIMSTRDRCLIEQHATISPCCARCWRMWLYRYTLCLSLNASSSSK